MIWIYYERDSLYSWHKVTIKVKLKQSINQSVPFGMNYITKTNKEKDKMREL